MTDTPMPAETFVLELPQLDTTPTQFPLFDFTTRIPFTPRHPVSACEFDVTYRLRANPFNRYNGEGDLTLVLRGGIGPDTAQFVVAEILARFRKAEIRTPIVTQDDALASAIAPVLARAGITLDTVNPTAVIAGVTRAVQDAVSHRSAAEELTEATTALKAVEDDRRALNEQCATLTADVLELRGAANAESMAHAHDIGVVEETAKEAVKARDALNEKLIHVETSLANATRAIEERDEEHAIALKRVQDALNERELELATTLKDLRTTQVALSAANAAHEEYVNRVTADVYLRVERDAALAKVKALTDARLVATPPVTLPPIEDLEIPVIPPITSRANEPDPWKAPAKAAPPPVVEEPPPPPVVAPPVPAPEEPPPVTPTPAVVAPVAPPAAPIEEPTVPATEDGTAVPAPGKYEIDDDKLVSVLRGCALLKDVLGRISQERPQFTVEQIVAFASANAKNVPVLSRVSAANLPRRVRESCAAFQYGVDAPTA